ncbi:MAG: hypothetical protein ACE5HB_08025 [Terriglobia bacterium]
MATPRERSNAPNVPVAQREADALYQNGHLVARAVDPQVDEKAKEIRFPEVYQSDELLLPDEFEFQKYVLLVRDVDSATLIDKTSRERGRVLRGVRAEILGYSEQ